jgi:hypothetical protein
MSIEFPNVMTSGTDASAIKQQFSFFRMGSIKDVIALVE